MSVYKLLKVICSPFFRNKRSDGVTNHNLATQKLFLQLIYKALVNDLLIMNKVTSLYKALALALLESGTGEINRISTFL